MKLIKRIPSEIQYGYYQLEVDEAENFKLSEFVKVAQEIESQVEKDKIARQEAKQQTKILGDLGSLPV